MTRADAEAHQRKHGFLSGLIRAADEAKQDKKVSRKRGMTRPEREFAVILEAQKRRGEIERYRYEGVRLRWGGDMWYKPDFFVTYEDEGNCFKCIEVKGPWISERDLVRFKGCKAEWTEFEFEMWQRSNEGRWAKLL